MAAAAPQQQNAISTLIKQLSQVCHPHHRYSDCMHMHCTAEISWGIAIFLGITCEGACLTKENVAAAAPQQQNTISPLFKQLSQVRHPHDLQA